MTTVPDRDHPSAKGRGAALRGRGLSAFFSYFNWSRPIGLR